MPRHSGPEMNLLKFYFQFCGRNLIIKDGVYSEFPPVVDIDDFRLILIESEFFHGT